MDDIHQARSDSILVMPSGRMTDILAAAQDHDREAMRSIIPASTTARQIERT
jgi:hypothetical protein